MQELYLPYYSFKKFLSVSGSSKGRRTVVSESNKCKQENRRRPFSTPHTPVVFVFPLPHKLEKMHPLTKSILWKALLFSANLTPCMLLEEAAKPLLLSFHLYHPLVNIFRGILLQKSLSTQTFLLFCLA